MALIQQEYKRGKKDALKKVASNLIKQYGFSYNDISLAFGLSRARIGQLMLEYKEEQKANDLIGARNARKLVR